jgi:hypothetical protein
MTESTTGLILRTYPLTETSLIVHWLTPDVWPHLDSGQRSRAGQSPLFEGSSTFFYLADFSSSAAVGQLCTSCTRSVCAKPTANSARNFITSTSPA